MIPFESWQIPQLNNKLHYVAGVFMLWVFGSCRFLLSLVSFWIPS